MSLPRPLGVMREQPDGTWAWEESERVSSGGGEPSVSPFPLLPRTYVTEPFVQRSPLPAPGQAGQAEAARQSSGGGDDGGWPWWWLLVAFGVGAGVGRLARGPKGGRR